jgi:hypothetical protein
MTVGRLGLHRAMLALILALAMPVLPPTALRAEPATLPSRLETLLKGGDYKSLAQVNDTAWTLDFNGKRLARFRVVVTLSEKENGGIIVAFVNPVSKAQLPKNSVKLMTILLQANHEFDYVKVGIDDDGDLFVREDLPPDTGPARFRNAIEQLAAATDVLYGRIKPLLR